MAGRSGRCIVVLACRSSSPVWLGPFEAVSKPESGIGLVGGALTGEDTLDDGGVLG